MAFVSRTIGVHHECRAATVEIVCFQPEPWDTAYRCKYSIRLDGTELRTFTVGGVDGVQALLYAMSGLIRDLEHLFPDLYASIPRERLEIFDAVR